MADKNIQTIKKPNSHKDKEDEEFIIRVMPKEFFGKDVEMKSKKSPIVPVAKKPAESSALSDRPPLVSNKKVRPPVQEKRSPIFIVLLVILIVAVIGVGTFGIYYFWLYEPAVEVEYTPEPEPEPELEPEPESEPEPIMPRRGVDTDSDGLTDVEERLYGTDYRNPDSDGDSFLDGNEVFHRYDPLGFAPSTLLDTGAVAVFNTTNESESWSLNFSVTYPTGWSVDKKADFVEFSLQTEDQSPQFSIELYEKEDTDETVQEWYQREKIPENGATDLKVVTTKNGYEGLESDDQRSVYLNLGEYVAEFIYVLDDSLMIHHSQTFQMFVNSFSVQP